MKRIGLFATTTLLAFSMLAPASARDVKIDCATVTFETAMPTGVDGAPMFIKPDIIQMACNTSQDVYVLPGFAGEYKSVEAIEQEIDKSREVLEGPSMKGVAIEALPPSLKFVKNLMNQKAAALKNKTADNKK